MLFHVSEEPGITRFAPRESRFTDDLVVWAIDREHLRNYLLPRECPRVTFCAASDSAPADVARFLGSSRAVVAFEAEWLQRIQETRLCCYHMPDASFECLDRDAGYYVSRETVSPVRVDMIEDSIAAIAATGCEIRILPTLWPLYDAVVASSLSYSIIRMQNAVPRQETQQAAARRTRPDRTV
ncbi:MAG: DUF6886 family protein [Planctomycetaceae bacterium]